MEYIIYYLEGKMVDKTKISQQKSFLKNILQAKNIYSAIKKKIKKEIDLLIQSMDSEISQLAQECEIKFFNEKINY